ESSCWGSPPSWYRKYSSPFLSLHFLPPSWHSRLQMTVWPSAAYEHQLSWPHTEHGRSEFTLIHLHFWLRFGIVIIIAISFWFKSRQRLKARRCLGYLTDYPIQWSLAHRENPPFHTVTTFTRRQAGHKPPDAGSPTRNGQ